MNNKFRLIVTIIVLSIFLLMSVGYATYNIRTSIGGKVGFNANGEVAITNVVLSDYSNLSNPENPTYTKDSISFDLVFNVDNNSALAYDYYAEYDVTITNDSFYDYEFASSVFTPSIDTSTNENMNVDYVLDGIELGEIIPALDSKSFKVRIIMYPLTAGEHNVTGDTNVVLEEEKTEPTGSLLASIPKNSTIDLRGSTVRDKVTVTVINSYSESKSFSFSISNSNFKLVNSSGTALGSFNIDANTTNTYDVYIERKNGVTFATNQQSINLVFANGSSNTSLGSIKILVDKDETLLDDEPPVISNVNATFVAENGKVNLTWDATDISSISYFIIEAYNSSDTLVETYQTSNGNTSYTATGLSNGTYYFRVYGVDSKNNNGKNVATSCETTSGYCSRSTSATYTWVFTVSYTLGTNISRTSGPTEIAIGETLSAIFSVSGNRNFNNITVTMDGRTLKQNSEYTWSTSGSTGTLSIPNASGNITVNITSSGAGCLVEGTKIKLANGKNKKIEDINYTDLLSVWSYESGKLTYEYPIWIEKSEESDSYEKTTFSDGTVLKTAGLHQVFSLDENKFVNIYDENGYIKVGTKVAKEVNGKIVPVYVTKVETIYKTIKYYYVASSIYYNIISENIITTSDQIVPGVTLSNMYGFDNNIKWLPIRKEIINKPGALFKYEDLKVMPYYLYLGSRGNETKLFVNMGYATTEGLIDYLLNTQLDPKRAVSVNTNKEGNRLWMVTTNVDKILNYKDYLHEEGSYYTLPKVLGVKKWYCTFDNKYYYPNDKVKVDYPMHFIAIK